MASECVTWEHDQNYFINAVNRNRLCHHNALWRVCSGQRPCLRMHRDACGRPGSRCRSWVGASCSQTVLMPSSPGAALPLRRQSQQEFWPLLVFLWATEGGPEWLTPWRCVLKSSGLSSLTPSTRGLCCRPHPSATISGPVLSCAAQVGAVSASCCVPRRSASTHLLLPPGSHREKLSGLSFFLPASGGRGSPAEKEAEVSTPPHTHVLTAWILCGCSRI